MSYVEVMPHGGDAKVPSGKGESPLIHCADGCDSKQKQVRISYCGSLALQLI